MLIIKWRYRFKFFKLVYFSGVHKMMSLHDEADLRDLWYEVNDSKSIVIYCGAGVTADRTGVGC